MPDGVSYDATIECDKLSGATNGVVFGGGGGAGGARGAGVMGYIAKRKATHNQVAANYPAPCALPPPPLPGSASSPREGKKADYLASVTEPRPKTEIKTKDKEEVANKNLKVDSKLDSKLLSMLKSDPQTEKLEVRVTLNLTKPVSSSLMELLKKAGLTDIVQIATTGQTKVTGKITATNLRKLIALAQVLKVESIN
jgi:hypothetical protein